MGDRFRCKCGTRTPGGVHTACVAPDCQDDHSRVGWDGKISRRGTPAGIEGDEGTIPAATWAAVEKVVLGTDGGQGWAAVFVSVRLDDERDGGTDMENLQGRHGEAPAARARGEHPGLRGAVLTDGKSIAGGRAGTGMVWIWSGAQGTGPGRRVVLKGTGGFQLTGRVITCRAGDSALDRRRPETVRSASGRRRRGKRAAWGGRFGVQPVGVSGLFLSVGLGVWRGGGWPGGGG